MVEPFERSPSVYDCTHLGHIIAGHGTHFSADLFRLIAKADTSNLAQLRLAYPDHVAAYEAWYSGHGE